MGSSGKCSDDQDEFTLAAADEMMEWSQRQKVRMTHHPLVFLKPKPTPMDPCSQNVVRAIQAKCVAAISGAGQGATWFGSAP